MPLTENIIELHFADQGGQVRIVPPDRDLMAMSVETAIEACRAFKNQIVFRDQFDLLLHRLGQWVSPRRQKLSRAYVTTRDAGLLFLVVLDGVAYDAELDEELTSLDLEIANDNDFSLINLSVLALPRSEDEHVQSFLSKVALRYSVNGN